MKDVLEELRKEIGDTTLVAVSKTKSNEKILEAYNLGIKEKLDIFICSKVFF